jgi:hypothetical protein
MHGKVKTSTRDSNFLHALMLSLPGCQSGNIPAWKRASHHAVLWFGCQHACGQAYRVSLRNNKENESDKREHFVGLLFIRLLFNVDLMFSTICSLLHFHALAFQPVSIHDSLDIHGSARKEDGFQTQSALKWALFKS